MCVCIASHTDACMCTCIRGVYTYICTHKLVCINSNTGGLKILKEKISTVLRHFACPYSPSNAVFTHLYSAYMILVTARDLDII